MQSFIDHFYVCEDLSKLGPLDIQRFDTLQEAVTAYQTLSGDKVKALGVQNTLPRPGTLDFVQHLNGKDILLSDCLRLPAWRNAEIQKIWSELRELLPDVQQRTIRFITPEYKDLFALQDGESLKMRCMDGTTKTTPCFACSDGYHFYLGTNQLFHICQFAEINRANGTIYMPQTSHEGERADTYEIYQVNRYSTADYRFADYAFTTWNEKLTELWGLVTTSPATFKGGAVWGIIQTIHGAMLAIGYALVILFFAMSLFKNTANFHELKRPEAALHYLIRFVAAKTAVGYGMEIMLKVFEVCNGIVSEMAASMGGISQAMVSLPGEVQTAIENVGFLASIPLWLVTILGSLFITVLSFIMILTVYGRFFRLYMYTALAPIPLATFAGDSTQSVGVAFLKTYVGVCMEGAVIVLACIIYAGFVGTPVVTTGEATTMVWSYLAETVFNMLVLVGLIKGSDRIVHEMMGL